jgi:16S rRNA C967 or C1407 C5-methylase (RsmB/RsmF family)
VVNILEGAIPGKRPWEDLHYSTCSKSPETQQLTVIQHCEEWLATIPDGKLPTNQKIEG